MEKSITFVGLDVHKDTIVVALGEAGERKEVREYGTIANTTAALQKLTSTLARGKAELRFCYEAGPCGYGIQRQLSAAGHECIVVAPWRQEGLPRAIRDTAWKAQERLCRRYRKLLWARKLPTVAATAIARELAGFVWAIAREI